MIQEAIHTDLFRLIAPECLTVVTALIILAVSFGRKTTQSSSGPLYGVIGMIGLALAFVVSLFYQSTGFSLGSAFIVTDATRWIKAGLLLMGFLIFGNTPPLLHILETRENFTRSCSLPSQA